MSRYRHIDEAIRGDAIDALEKVRRLRGWSEELPVAQGRELSLAEQTIDQIAVEARERLEKGAYLQ